MTGDNVTSAVSNYPARTADPGAPDLGERDESGRVDRGYFMTVREAAGLPAHEYPDERIRAMMKMSVPADVSFSQAAVFLGICHRYGLDPTVGQIWLAQTDDGVQVLTGRDTFISVAEARNTYRGYVLGVVFKGEDAVIRRDPTDPWTVTIDHPQSFATDGEEIVGGYVVVYDSERPPLILRRWWKDYTYLLTTRSGKKRRNWARDPKGMFENRLIAAGLRRMYSLSGIMMVGEEDDLGGSGIEDKGAEAHARNQADELRSKLEAAETTVNIIDVWHPDLVIQSGKYLGKTWREVAGSDPDWARRAAKRRWHGLDDDGAEVLLELIGEAPQDAQEEPEEAGAPELPPEPSSQAQAPSRPSLDELLARGEAAREALIERNELEWAESEELDLLHYDGNYDGLQAHVDHLERKVKGGEV